MKKFLLSLFALLGVLNAQAAWEKATSISVGDVVVFAFDNENVAKELSEISLQGSSMIGKVADYTDAPEGLYPLTVVAGSQDGTFAFKTTADTYLSWSSGNSLTTAEEVTDASSWTVSLTDAGAADIYNVGTTTRKLQYNAGSPRFACYTSTQQTPYLWKQVSDGSVAKPNITPASTAFAGSIEVTMTAEEGATIYYTLDGTDPTTGSSAYSEALTITETTTVKAIAVADEVSSAVAEATYTALSKSTLADAQAAEAGTQVYVEGTIVASAANGAVLYDGTDYLYYYNNANALAVGQVVRMVGTLATYGGAKQLPAATVITELGTEAVAHPAATALDGAAFDAIQTAAVATRQYVSFIGTLNISGNYYNITIDGAGTAVGSIVKPNEDLSALDGKNVFVKGYLMYVNNKYVYTVATSVKEVGAIENSDFSAATIIDNHICTYAKDMESNGTTFSQMQEVAGWTIANNGDARAAGVMAYGSDKWIGGAGYAVPAFNPAGLVEGQGLGIVAVWSADAQYTQDVVLPAGYYLVSARINNVGGTTATATNFFGARVGETNHFAANKAYAVGTWTRENVTFQVEEAAEGYISLGYKATNAGNAAQQHLFYDGVIVKVFETEEARTAFIEDQATADATDAAAYALAVARAEALAAIDAFSVGDALFQYSQDAIDAAKAAIAAAETVEAIEAAMPAQNLPETDKLYSFQLKDGGNYMTLDGGTKLAAKAMGFSFVPDNGGGYAITNGTEYVACTGTGDNIWSMGTATEPYSWVITYLADGYYTLAKASNNANYIGVDDTAAGSSCFANKGVSDKASWAIAEYVAPTLYTVSIAEGLENGTVAAEPTSAEAGEKVQLTATPAEGYALESYSVTCKTIDEVVLVAEDGTFTMPADDVTVSATFVEAAPVSGVTLVASEGAYAASANNYVKEWTSNTNPIVTVTTGANNMDKRVTETFLWHSGSAGSSTYTISVPINYIITSCTITAKGNSAEQTITAGETEKTFGTADYEELVLSELSNPSTSFTLTGANASGLLIQKIELGIAPNPNFNISNDKAYALTTPRGSLGVSDGQLVSTAKDFTASNFAIISYNDAYYLWSVEAGRFIQDTGDASNYAPTPISFVALDGGKFQLRYGNNAINISSGYAPGLIINGWTTVDPGNTYTIEAAADFDATEALAILETPITFTNKVTDLANLSNVKAYVITNARGTWNVNYGETAMTPKKFLPDAASEQFALLQQQGQYFIYSVNAKKFLNPDNTFGKPVPVNISATGNEDYPWFFAFDDSHNINVSGGEVVINGWSTIDEGNSNAIIEATDFDSKDAMAALYEYFRLFADGKYYISNVGTGKYLAAGSNWGTHAVVNADGLDYDIKMADGKYTLDSQVSNGGNNHYLNGEWNDGAAMGWIFNEVSEGVYTISNGTNFLTAGENGVVTLAADGTVDAAKWTLKTLEDRIAELAAATAETPVDATFLIQDANFGRNDLRKSAWTMVASNQNLSGGEDNNNGSVGNNCAESYHSTFTLSQTLANAPAGKYKMTAQGFYRQDDGATEDLPVFYANDKTANFPAKTGSEGSMTDASKSFSAGQYTIEPIEVTVFENGQLTVGAKGTAVHQWVIFDNFRLSYLGSEIPAEEFAPAYETALSNAKKALDDETYAAVTGEERTALAAAIETYSTVEETVDAYKTAISALTAATTTFTGAKADYDALVAAKAANAERSYAYADADKKAAAEASLTVEATSAADAKEKATAIWTAFRKYADSHALAEGVEGAINMTDHIVNPNAEEAIAEPWTVVKGEGSGGSLTILNGEPLTDGEGNTYKYFDGGDWGANAWDVALKQTITLPAGKYMITASGRASGDVQLSLLVGEEKTAIPAIGASGGLFGNGWDDASKEFELATESDVVIGVQGVTSVVHNWMSFTRFRLVCLEKGAEPVDPTPEDVTALITNPAYIGGYDGWTYSENGFKSRNYEAPMNLITYSGNAAFEVSQTLKDVPAGLYELSVYAFYRAGSLDDEKAKIAAGTELEKELTMYAAIGEDTYSHKVMNLSEGATETNYFESKSAQLANGLYVPDAADAARAWYIAGAYKNNVKFNVFEAGDVTIGLSKTVGLASDYCPVGAWQLVRLGDADAEAATPDEKEEKPELNPGDDATSYITNPSFETGDLTGWTVVASDDTGVKPNSNGTYTTEGCDGDYLFNTWWKGNPITQTVTGLPNGQYELKALMANNAGDGNNDKPCLYLLANGEHSEAFSSATAGVFAEGSMQFYVTNGTVTIGAVGGNADGSFNADGYYWYKVDNFRLTYVAALPGVDEIEIPEGKMSNAAAAAITTAKEAGNSAALIEAVTAAKASIAAYAHVKSVLDEMTDIVDNTNVYTADAKATYDAAYATALQAYTDGSMADADAKAFNYGSRKDGLIPELLLSAFTSTVENVPYINTWSVEGNNDGSNYKTPFFEYWTNDGESLGAATFTAEMTDLEAGDYDVTAWVRVRIKNGAEAPATGITLQANEGEVVNVADGAQVGTSQFYLKEATATATVAEDGKLTIKFNVAEGNNISWLSFKNVKFAKKGAAPTTYAINISAGENGKVESDKAQAAEGETVTITVTPDEGYMVDEVSVTYGEDQPIEWETLDMETLTGTFLMPAADVNVLFTFKEVEEKTYAAVKMTWVDYSNPEASVGEVETAQAGYNKIANGEVGFGNTGWGCNWITYLQVDASEYKGAVKSAVLTFEGSGSTDSKRQTTWGVGYNSSEWSAEMTYSKADKSITLLNATQTGATKSSTVFEEYAFDITEAFANGKVATILIYETAAAGGYVKNPVVKVEMEPTAPELANPSFDENPSDVVTVTTQGYERNIPAESDQVAGMQPVTGWTPGFQTADDPGYTGGVFAYGSTNLLNNKVAAPAADPNGEDGVALGLAAVWAGVAQYTQEVTLPAGDYKFTYVVYNGANTGEVAKNLFGFIATDDTEYLSEKKSFTVGEWDAVEVLFTVDKETTGKISVGFIGSGGSGAAPHLFVDHVALTKVPGIDAAKAELQKTIEAAQAEAEKYVVGEGIFMYAESEIAPLTTAIATATDALNDAEATKESINTAKDVLTAFVEAFAPVATLPDAEQSYSIFNKQAQLYMTLSADGISIAEEAYGLKFEAAEGGKYYITDGTYYVGLVGTDNWSMTSDAAKKEALTVSVKVVEGVTYYSFAESKGLVGVDYPKKDNKGCWANKAAGDGDAVLWTIAEFEPIPVGIKGLAADDKKASIYDLSGRKVEKMVKGGIYIVNGKKVSFK